LLQKSAKTTAGASRDTGTEVVARLNRANQVVNRQKRAGETDMNRGLELFGIVLFALNAGVVSGGVTSSRADEAGVEVSLGDLRGEVLSLFAPRGALATETNPNYRGAAAPAPAVPPSPAAADWPSYNKTLTSERFSDLSQINTKNVGKLKVLCTYDTWRLTAFETGLIMVEGALIGTTEFDIFSINPATCAENWRTHEEYPAYILPTNRGAAYFDGMLFRGTQDGRVLAYDFKTGKRLWETTIGDAKKAEDVPAAPIAWQGLVFVGNAGGDFKGGKGHMYALDAKTGEIVWQFFLVPKAEGDTVRGPEGASPLDNSTWKNVPGAPISGGGAWTSTTTASARGTISSPVPSLSSTPGPARTRNISSLCPGIGTTGTSPTRRL
jgi:putative pyrroloquinoline-quinone binding quinoprotein